MEQEIKVQLGVKLWPGGEVQQRIVALGLLPGVLIGINPISQDQVHIQLDASQFSHIKEVYEVFQVITDGLKELADGKTEANLTLGDK